MRSNASATIVLRIVFGPEQDWLEPGARNSNLLPVKANGLVRLRSVASRGSGGSVSAPIFIAPGWRLEVGAPFSSWSITSASWSPRYIEMIAGGASFAPSRWSLPAPVTAARSRSLCRFTASMIAVSTVRKIAFWCGSLPGLSRLFFP